MIDGITRERDRLGITKIERQRYIIIKIHIQRINIALGVKMK